MWFGAEKEKMARRRKTKNEKRATNNQFLIASIVVAVLIAGLFIGAATVRSTPASLGEEKVVKFVAPNQVVAETKQEAPTPPAATAPSAPEKLPDLQLQLFSTYSGETKQAIRITTDVFNKGDVDITSKYKVTYGYEKKIGTNRVDYITVGTYDVTSTHKAGQTKTFAFLWMPDTAGVYDFKVCADYENAVKESNEENNCVKSTVTVKDFGKYG